MNNDVMEIELSIEEARHDVELFEALQRLRKSDDFNKVISRGYFVEEPARLAQLMGDLNVDVQVRKHCLQMIKGVGTLAGYFQALRYKANQATMAMEEAKEEQERILQEDIAGGSA